MTWPSQEGEEIKSEHKASLTMLLMTSVPNIHFLSAESLYQCLPGPVELLAVTSAEDRLTDKESVNWRQEKRSQEGNPTKEMQILQL